MKNRVNIQADNGGYKFDMYRKMNPSHKLPVETGRWYGIRNRNDRVCSECGVLGDEVHYLYNCAQIKRDDVVLPQNLDELWQNPNVFKLFSRLEKIGVL